MLFITPLIKWYIEHGLTVENIDLVIEYKPNKCFQEFGEKISEMRRKGDKNPNTNILSNVYKLFANSAYGKVIENRSKRKKTLYVSDPSSYVGKKFFLSESKIDESLYEVTLNVESIKWDLPLQIGVFVLQYAKMRMLQFYFDCLLKYLDFNKFQCGEMDTDSMYFSTSGYSIEDIIRDRKGFFENYHLFFPSQACDLHKSDFIRKKINNLDWKMKKCCLQRNIYDQRSPGLFKIEYEGDAMIALAPKTYICSSYETSIDDEKTGRKKTSTKGLNKKLNDFTTTDFIASLNEKKARSGINKGFKIKNHRIFTYEQERAGLPYLYIKRKVNSDRITTRPLLI